MSEVSYQPNLPVFDEMDREIIKHKQVHFSSSFNAMIEYYEKEKKGAVLPILVDRLRQLQEIELSTGCDLATLILSKHDIQEIKKAKDAYHKLQNLANKEPDFVNLIFSEKENPQKLIEKTSKNNSYQILLTEVVKNDDYYNPLFPGYGLAPILAAKALALRKEEHLIPILFERIGEVEFEIEMQFLHLISNYGAKAQEFLLKVLNQKEFTRQVKRAILALSHFPQSEKIAQNALHKLEQLDLDKPEPALISLIELCRALKTKHDRACFSNLKEKKQIHKEIFNEIIYIERSFNNQPHKKDSPLFQKKKNL